MIESADDRGESQEYIQEAGNPARKLSTLRQGFSNKKITTKICGGLWNTL